MRLVWKQLGKQSGQGVAQYSGVWRMVTMQFRTKVLGPVSGCPSLSIVEFV